MATRKLTRTIGGTTDEAWVILWDGVRVMRGVPSPDGPQGAFEVIAADESALATTGQRVVDDLLAEGFAEIVALPPPAPRPRVAEPPRAPSVPSKPNPVKAAPRWMKAIVPPLDKQLAKLRKTLTKAGLAHRAAEIEALTLPGIDLSVKKAKPADLKAVVSRLGGDPDLPPGMKWPVVNGTPLQFLAQVVVAEVKELDIARVLPPRGVLSFFAQLDPNKDNYGESGWVGELALSPKLVRTRAPDGVGRIETPGLLRPKLRLTLPPSEGPAIEALGLNADEGSAYHDEVFLPSIPEGRQHVVGGWPTAATALGIQGKRFQAQFDSDHRIGFEMGDYETLRFFIDGDKALCTMAEA